MAQTHFQLVKDAIRKADGDAKRKELVLSHLSDVDHRIPILGGAAEGTLERIDKMLATATVIKEILTQQGADPMQGSVDQYAAFVRNELAKWAKVVAAAGLKVE